jgi:L-fuconolactonase
MQIVDAQVHIWAASTPGRPWPERGLPQRPVPFSADDLLEAMDNARVKRAIIVPPSWEGERNDLALAAARSHPGRFAVMGRFDVTSPNARERVAGWRKQPGMLGMRFTFKLPDAQAALAQGRLDWFWAEAELHHVPLMINASHAQISLLERLADHYPTLRLTVDHLGLISGEKDETAFARLDQLLRLATRQNVAVKASALPAYSTDVYPYRSLHRYLRQVYDAFGPKRIFWGSDITRMPITYSQTISMFTEEIPWLTAEDKEWIMGRGICEWLGWQS